MTYILDHDPEIARAAYEVVWLETLRKGLRNATVPWHAWNDELEGQNRMAIDESHRALVVAVAGREDWADQSADVDGGADAAPGAAEENATPERAGRMFCARGSARVCGRHGTRLASAPRRMGRGCQLTTR